MKKSIAILLALVILIAAFPSSVFADAPSAQGTTESEALVAGSNLLTATISEEDIFITAEEAEYIAQRFIADTIAAGLSSWDDETTIVSTVTMYDQTNLGNITAYCVELNAGYIVVSAYAGTENIIFEWSDIASPIYKELDISDSDRIVYTGALEYYKDSGTATLETPDGNFVKRAAISNAFERARDVQNTPCSVLSSIIQERQSVSTAAVITDPFKHADSVYAGPFKYYEHINKWDSSSSSLSLVNMSSFDCKNHCGPTAITNMLKMYGNRFSVSSIKKDSVKEIFNTVLGVGGSKYYFNADIEIGDDIVLGGTVNAWAGAYIKDCFSEYGLNASCTKKDISYDNVKSSLANDHLLYLMVMGHSTYGNHHMVCYAYTRLVSTTTGLYKTYLKVADGWSTSPRYVDLATATSDEYWDAKISR